MGEEVNRPGPLSKHYISPVPHLAPGSEIVNPNFNNCFSPHSLAPLCSAASASQTLKLWLSAPLCSASQALSHSHAALSPSRVTKFRCKIRDLICVLISATFVLLVCPVLISYSYSVIEIEAILCQ